MTEPYAGNSPNTPTAGPLRVVFLDVDGVLNSQPYWTHHLSLPATERGDYAIDPAAVARVDRLLEEADAYVVVSSSLRWGESVTKNRDQLRRWGFRHYRRCLGGTPSLRNKPRGAEIELWLQALRHPVDRFVILDDDRDMEPHMEHLVQTSYATGMTDEDVERALVLLR